MLHISEKKTCLMGIELAPRVEALKEHLRLPRVSCIREYIDNVVVIIPTYTAARRDLIDTATQSVLMQTMFEGSPSITLVIADNGLSDDERRDLHRRTAAAVSDLGCNVCLAIVDAHPQGDRESAPSYQRTAAFARNRAIKHVITASKTDSRFRGDVFLLDDDAALVGPSLLILHRSLWGQGDRQAVVPSFLPTKDLASDWRALNSESAGLSDVDKAVGVTRDLPNQFVDDTFDLSTVIALSGEVSTKTAALVVSRRLIDTLHEKNDMLFEVFPQGSFEDMAFGAVASRQGVIAHNAAARCLDLARPDPESLKRQKIQWGRDHVQALVDFNDLGLLYDGITIFEPGVDAQDQNKPIWVQRHVQSAHRGVVINPRQLHATVLPVLRQQISQGVYDGMGQGFERLEMMRALESAESTIQALLSDQHMGSIKCVRRPELGSPVVDDAVVGTRFAPEVLAFQVAGNLVGIRDVNTRGGAMPLRFVLGARQRTRYD